MHDWYYRKQPETLYVHNRWDDVPDEMEPEWYFRQPDDWPPFELKLMEYARGRVLDIGAGVGSHSLLLQEAGASPVALELDPHMAAISRDRGLENVVQEDVFTYTQEEGFDTFLLIMNGFGLARNEEGLYRLLRHLKTLANPGASILADSSNISYLLEQMDLKLPKGTILNEWAYRYEYKGELGEWNTWLYADQEQLATAADATGWSMQIIDEDDMDAFIVELSLPD